MNDSLDLTEPLDPRAWAHRLREREEAGESLTPAQKEAWRKALHQAEPSMGLVPLAQIPVEALPPGMRPDAHTVAPDGDEAP